MKRKNNLGMAIYELNYLLDNDMQDESQYQLFFEKNNIVFEILGYQKSFSMTSSGINLPRDENTGLKPEPDFIAQNNIGLYEIFELKTPVNKKLLIDRNAYRTKFTSEVCSYISQTITYEKYFTRNPVNREFLKNKHNIDLNEDLDIKIIIGRNSNINKNIIHSKCRELTWKVDIITYDDILEILKKEYNENYGKYENLKGFSFHFIVRFHKSDVDGYFLDVGNVFDKNRFSFYVDKNNDFNVVVIDDNGRKHSLMLEGDSNDLIDNWIYLICEFGNSGEGFVMNLYLNGIEKEIIKKDSPIKIDNNLSKYFLGANINEEKFGKFDIAEMVIRTKTLKYEDKISFIEYIIKKYGENIEVDGGIEFDGTKYMLKGKKGFIQNNDKYKPKYITPKSKKV